jgi:hypothetical protein
VSKRDLAASVRQRLLNRDTDSLNRIRTVERAFVLRMREILSPCPEPHSPKTQCRRFGVTQAVPAAYH